MMGGYVALHLRRGTGPQSLLNGRVDNEVASRTGGVWRLKRGTPAQVRHIETGIATDRV